VTFHRPCQLLQATSRKIEVLSAALKAAMALADGNGSPSITHHLLSPSKGSFGILVFWHFGILAF
jgi:hypothetical protein